MVKELTTENTKEISHKGHGGGLIQRAGRDYYTEEHRGGFNAEGRDKNLFMLWAWI